MNLWTARASEASFQLQKSIPTILQLKGYILTSTPIKTISVTQSLRPTRYAFIINKTDRRHCLRAVSIYTALWGGIYNPILDIKDEHLLGAIEEFDPDYLVNLTGTNLNLPNIPAVAIEEDALTKENGFNDKKKRLALGLNVIPLYQRIYLDEIRLQNDETRFKYVKTNDADWSDYVSFIFGTFDSLPQVDTQFQKLFIKAFKGLDFNFDPSCESDYSHF